MSKTTDENMKPYEMLGRAYCDLEMQKASELVRDGWGEPKQGGRTEAYTEICKRLYDMLCAVATPCPSCGGAPDGATGSAGGSMGLYSGGAGATRGGGGGAGFRGAGANGSNAGTSSAAANSCAGGGAFAFVLGASYAGGSGGSGYLLVTWVSP